MALNYKYLAAAIAIPEVCRFVTACIANSQSEKPESKNIFFGYIGPSPIGGFMMLAEELNKKSSPSMSNIKMCMGFTALGLTTPIACYFAMTRELTFRPGLLLLRTAPALVLCAVQCSFSYIAASK